MSLLPTSTSHARFCGKILVNNPKKEQVLDNNSLSARYRLPRRYRVAEVEASAGPFPPTDSSIIILGNVSCAAFLNMIFCFQADLVKQGMAFIKYYCLSLFPLHTSPHCVPMSF